MMVRRKNDDQHQVMTFIPIEVSARHIHVTKEDWEELFGYASMEVERAISQEKQFVAKQRVVIRGPKGEFGHVAVVGPVRSKTQAELSMTDARALGIAAPLTGSGELDDAATVTVIGTVGTIERNAAIIPQRHLHIAPDEAKEAGLKDHQTTSVRIEGPRAAVLDNVLVRIHPDFQLRLHLDTDEGNACGVQPGMTAELLV